MLTITDEKQDGVWICVMSGRLDGTTSATADQHLAGLAANEEASAVVLDFSSLEYMSSAGLRVLLMAVKRAKNGSSRLALASPQETVKQVLEISGFTSILDIHPTRSDALKSLAN